MVVPLLPDSGYAEFAANNATGGASGSAFNGNLEARDAASPGADSGIQMTSKVLTTDRLISRTYIANEVEEDAIMPILPLIRESMVRAHARAIEHSILMGGATVTQGVVNPGGPNGLVKIADGDSKILDTGSPGVAVATTAQLLNMRQAMGKYGRRPSDVVYIVSLDAYYDLLDDAEFQDVNLVGSERASKVTGEIGQAYGSAVIVCDEFSSGRTQGAAWGVAVNTNAFSIPVLRGTTIEQDYDVANQHRVLVATQRRGFDRMFSTAGQVVAHTW